MMEPGSVEFYHRLATLRAITSDPAVEGWLLALGIATALFEAQTNILAHARRERLSTLVTSTDAVRELARQALTTQLQSVERAVLDRAASHGTQ